MEMTAEIIMKYVKPELLVLVVVLYFVGVALKASAGVKDELIPALLGAVGVLLVLLWLLATTAITGPQDVAMLLFTALVQGVLVAGLAVYVNQLKVQAEKAKEETGK